jgi:hypothetical protein
MGLELAYGRARDIIGRERAECLDAAVEVERLRLACITFSDNQTNFPASAGFFLCMARN